MTNLSAGDTVNSTKSTTPSTTPSTTMDISQSFPSQSSHCQRVDLPGQVTRKRRRLDTVTVVEVIPEKSQRRNEKLQSDTCVFSSVDNTGIIPRNEENKENIRRDDRERKSSHAPNAPTVHSDAPCQRIVSTKRDETTRLRKTIQWLDEGIRRLREDLANARTELHEEKRASKIAKRETEAAIKEARSSEASKYQIIIAELKHRLAQCSSFESPRSPSPISSTAAKMEFMKEEHHKREVSALKKRLSEAEGSIRRLKWEALNLQTKQSSKADENCGELRRLRNEVRSLRAINEKLEEKLRIALTAEKARTTELRIQRENHESELSSLRKTIRSETIKMVDELREKNREIEKLSKKTQLGESRKRGKIAQKDDITMRKLRENERNGHIRSTEKRFFADDGHMVDTYIRELGCERAITEVEVERLRELALEQQEIIELLRQAVKAKERKLEQLSNKRRKEEFYRQWLELEPVAEVEDEEDHEEGDSALSSAPSSLSPQPGGWQGNGVTREAYEAVLIEIEELQTKLLQERQELSLASGRIRDLEKTLSQETKRSQNTELIEKLREAEEREAALLVELSEFREQNELLEFRLLELEETSIRRGSPDHTIDSGIASPESMQLNKDQSIKQRNRAVATVIPYMTTTTISNSRSVSPIPQKPSLTLQESGIFEEEDNFEIEFASRGTQTEPPAGELLQEVQRLQELRARIQERAVKVSNPIYQVEQKICNFENDVSMDSIVQLSPYQERIRDLEEKLEYLEKEEEERIKEEKVVKQREEELLDENYRLTERVYWLENELKNMETKFSGIIMKKDVVDEIFTGEILEGCESSETTNCPRCTVEKHEFTIENNGELLQNKIGKTENSSERNNNKKNAGGEGCEIIRCTVGVQTIETALDCSTCRIRNERRDNRSECWFTSIHRPVMIVEEIAEEAKEEKKETLNEDKAENSTETLTTHMENVSQVFLVPGEQQQHQQPDLEDVSLNQAESEKKVRQRRNVFREKEGWAMKTWSTNKISKIKDVFFEKRNCLVLYQEICV